MRHLITGFAGLTLAAGLATAGFAQTAAPAAAPATVTTIPAAPGALSVEKTPIGDLLADAGGKAVIEKDMPALIAYDGLEQIKGMTLRDISVYPQAELDDTKLASIQKDLDAAKK